MPSLGCNRGARSIETIEKVETIKSTFLRYFIIIDYKGPLEPMSIGERTTRGAGYQGNPGNSKQKIKGCQLMVALDEKVAFPCRSSGATGSSAWLRNSSINSEASSSFACIGCL